VRGSNASESYSRLNSLPIPPLPVNYARLPLTFEANKGQTDSQVRFLSRGKGYTAFLTAAGMVLSLRPSDVVTASSNHDAAANHTQQSRNSVLKFSLVGAAQSAQAIGEEQQPGRVNYFIGNDPAKWQMNVPTFGRVRYKNVYPGIDLIYYGNTRQLEYDFVVAPGADANQIKFEIHGTKEIALDSEGNLVLTTPSGDLHFQRPSVYQESASDARLSVDGGYIIEDATHIAFRVAHYDPGKPLVIDPVLLYSTYLGGSGNDQPTGIAVDSTGAVYISGYTDSSDFPLATLGSLPSGSTHVFVAKLYPTGSNLIYADYIGGNNLDYGYALTLDSSKNVYVTGSTASSNFPVVNAYQSQYPGSFNAFLTKISSSGSSLLYSTYLGGNGSDQPAGIAIDGLGNMLIAGNTTSTNFPVANAYQSTASANQGGQFGIYGFLTKFSSDGSSLIYSTYFGGSSNVAFNCGGTPCWPQPYSVISGIALDGTGDAYVGGSTNTYDFPATSGAYLTTNTTSQDATVGFTAKFSSSGVLGYSTYFYESSGSLTNINAIAVDTNGSAYVTGAALSDGTFPLTSTSICDPGTQGFNCSYAFVTKFNPAGSALLYSTFLGVNNFANPVAIALDTNNDAYVLASTSSNSFGLVNGIEPYSNAGDVIVAEIDPSAGSELFATYLGGSGDDNANALAVDSHGNLFATGATDSSDFPVSQTAFQRALGGNTDAFVVKIGPASAPSVTLDPVSLTFSTLPPGTTSQPQTSTLHNTGSAGLTISSITTNGDFAETDNCGTSVPAAGSCTFSVTFTPTTSGVRSGSIVIQDNAAGSPHTISLSGMGAGPAASFAPTSLTFSAQPVGTSSTAKQVTLTSSGTATLNISSIQVAGDYSQTNNCPAQLAASSSCTINVTFTPTTTGTRNGNLTVTDNASGGSQSVALAGSGSDFSLGISPASNTIKAGATATYTLTITPVGGSFPNAVQLACGTLPSHTSCSFSSKSVTPVASAATSTLSIATVSNSSEMVPLLPRSDVQFYAVWLQLPGFGSFGMFLLLPTRRMKKLRLFFLSILVLVGLISLTACAGGTGIAKQTGTTPGTYTVTITATSGNLQHSRTLTLNVQ
jgi:hypothetical protein